MKRARVRICNKGRAANFGGQPQLHRFLRAQNLFHEVAFLFPECKIKYAYYAYMALGSPAARARRGNRKRIAWKSYADEGLSAHGRANIEDCEYVKKRAFP